MCTLGPGQRLRIVKLLAYGWSALRTTSALRDQVAAALTGARYTGLEGLLAEQRAYLDEFWDGADVRGRGRPGGPAGGPVRAVPRPPGRRPRRSAAACPPRG